MENVDARQISSHIWAMANELRGTMDAGEYKTFILSFMFYRYLSEHQEQYLISDELVECEEGQSVNDAYVELVNDQGLDACLQDISSALGYAIEPQDTWATLVANVHAGDVEPGDYQRLFDNFNKHAELNREAVEDFFGVFDDINLGDSRLGSSTASRAKALGEVVKLVDQIEFHDESGRDILGEVYEYLIGKFAASAGKKGGEFYTPHEVSLILAKIVTLGLKKGHDAFSIYDEAVA